MSISKQELVERSQVILAHAWMVRTFIKHCDEADDFPELMGITRAVFDASRALETRVDDPDAYLKMLKKKISKLRKATDQFALDAPEASLHTNFEQAVISMKGCTQALEALLADVEE
ncbi:amidohydrolase [Gimesia panareensis]|uniref:amidohydrolase n=1 Tax=Gimesia panareensis TaxID=2527978 RepID=UPI0011892B6A|nr:amidohydrolase [Gimesia panareensis]QDU53358.1 hypothetical protein Pan110_57480 [Gimesia panareensis]